MELKPGLSAFITGGASGIGKALCLALAEKGVFVTVVDYSEEKGREVAILAEQLNSKFHPTSNFPTSLFLECDVTDTSQLADAFEKHFRTYGRLDICINGAGVGTRVLFYKDDSNGRTTWRRTVDVNLVAVIECTRLAIKTMQAKKQPGVIINMGSASGLYPMTIDPIYSASKGGVVMFTRSLAPLQREGIRVNVLCPEFIETEMALEIDPKIVSLLGGFIPMEKVIKGAFELIMDESKAGSCLWISNRRGTEYWPTPSEETKYSIPKASSRKKYAVKRNRKRGRSRRERKQEMVKVATYFAMTFGAFVFWQSIDRLHVWIALRQDEKMERLEKEAEIRRVREELLKQQAQQNDYLA